MTKTGLLLKWLAKEKKTISAIYFLAVVQGLLYILIPLVIQGIITYLMAGRFTASLFVLSTVTVIITTFIGFMQLWQMRIMEGLHEKIFGDAVERLSKVFNAGVGAEIRYKINHFFEVITLQKGIAKILLDFSFSIISIFFGLLLLPAYSNWFLIFTVLVSVIFYFIIRIYGNKALESNLGVSKRKYQIFELLKQYSGGVAGSEKISIDQESSQLLDSYFSSRKEYYFLLEKQFKWILAFKIFFVAILLFIGAYLVEAGELTIGQFVAAEIIILMVINSVEKLITSISTFYDVIVSIYKLEDIVNEKEGLSFVEENASLRLPADKNIYRPPYKKRTRQIMYALGLTTLVVLFLPWTQNIVVTGSVTALNPQQKPQSITSRIAGRIEKWYISDGDMVRKNDTIAFISEVKDDYFDPSLIRRSQEQIKSKETALESYSGKVNAINQQIDALNAGLLLKTEQLNNKIRQLSLKLESDSAEAVAAANTYQVSTEQFARYEELYKKGIISKTDLESRKLKFQEMQAKITAANNKVLQTRNEIINAEIELSSIRQEYNEKLMKAESEKFSVLSMIYEGEGSLAKMQNQLANYSVRQGFYYVVAPQDGYVRNITIRGIGEIVKEGGVLCDIVPRVDEQAVELYADPIDLPLITQGQKVQLIFDGWPVFVFSGWPGVSYGTYTAEIVAFDKAISENGKFRILAANKGEKWPDGIHIGGGVKGYVLLKDVPLIYEFWRKINGFPPDFYQPVPKAKAGAKDHEKK